MDRDLIEPSAIAATYCDGLVCHIVEGFVHFIWYVDQPVAGGAPGAVERVAVARTALLVSRLAEMRLRTDAALAVAAHGQPPLEASGLH